MISSIHTGLTAALVSLATIAAVLAVAVRGAVWGMSAAAPAVALTVLVIAAVFAAGTARPAVRGAIWG